MIVTVNLAKGAIAMSRKKVIVKRLQRHPEFRRDGRAVHRQDRHPDAGPHHPEALISISTARIASSVLQYAYLNSHYQSGLAKPARSTPCSTMSTSARSSTSTAATASSTKFRSTSCAGACRWWSSGRTASNADLQGRGGGDLRGLHPLRDRRRDRRSSTRAIWRPRRSETTELNEDGFRVVAVAYKEMPPAKTTYSVADEADLTLLGYIAFLDPPKESRARGHRRAGRARRGGEDPDRRQRDRHPQDLPRGRARCRRASFSAARSTS